MPYWKDLFESSLGSFYDREYLDEYFLGLGASDTQISRFEHFLGLTLPRDLREMYAEFNGVMKRANYENGRCFDDSYILTLRQIEIDIPDYFANCPGNPLPSSDELSAIIFFSQSNGFGDLWGYVVRTVRGILPGTIVRMDHDDGVPAVSHKSLHEFVARNRQ